MKEDIRFIETKSNKLCIFKQKLLQEFRTRNWQETMQKVS